MPLEGRLAIALIGALAAVFVLTPIAIRVAARFEFYDKPIGYKGHSRPTPYLGGSAIMLGFALVLALTIVGHGDRTLALLGGMAVLWVAGTIDDRINISPLVRVLLELGLATFLWDRGLGWETGLGGVVDLVLTAGWVVAVVNAFNLFDNMDGASATMATVASGCLVALGLIQGDDWLVVAAAALCGACLGFLPHNMASPAKIFLGDGGSMPVGFGIATLVMIGAAETASAGQSLVLGLLLVGVPATDTCLVIFSRRRRGIGILTGGRDHLTHRTKQWFSTARAVAIGLGGIQALVSAVALFAIHGGGTLFVAILVLYLVAGAVAIIFLEARWEAEAELQPAAGQRAPGWARPGVALLPLWLMPLALGLAAGVTPFAQGIYGPGRWAPAGLLLMVLATAAAIARPPRITRGQAIAGAALAGLGLFGLLSALWAPSIAEATTDANRWLMLAAAFAAVVVLVRSDRAALALTGGLALGIGAVAIYVLIRLFESSAAEMFLGDRLNEPLGYVNAVGAVFVMGFWLWFSLTEHRDHRVSGVGLGVSTLMAGLALLSQSRGTAIAAVVAIVAVLALPGRRVRRLFGLALVGAALFAAHGPVLALWRDPTSTALYSRSAVIAFVVTAVLVGAAWWAANDAYDRLATVDDPWIRLLPRVGKYALSALAVALAVVGVARAGAISSYVSDQWHSFSDVTSTAGEPAGPLASSHLASGSGFRSDYWRVALRAFGDQPFHGVGAGNYDRPYFRYRETTEDVHQPHSLIMQELAELGSVGGLLVLCLAGVVLLALWRQIRRGRREGPGIVPLAAAGVTVSWLTQTNLDWLHLIPGVSAIALAMAAVLLRQVPVGGPVREQSRRRLRVPVPRAVTTPVAAAIAGSLVLVIAAGSLSRDALARLYRDRARNALPDRPADAVKEANRSLRLDSETPQTYYIKAAALARFDDAAAARRTLRTAVAKEPDNFVTWTLLGDLAVRVGDLRGARTAYRTAHRLNPADPDLSRLARDPSAAEG